MSLQALAVLAAASMLHVTPVSDSRLRFHAIGHLLPVHGSGSIVAVRCEDLGSEGNPDRDLAFKNRWHYRLVGAQHVQLVDAELKVTAEIVYSGEMKLSIQDWGTLVYVAIDKELRPDRSATESNVQRVVVTRLDDFTYDVLIEEPVK